MPVFNPYFPRSSGLYNNHLSPQKLCPKPALLPLPRRRSRWWTRWRPRRTGLMRCPPSSPEAPLRAPEPGSGRGLGSVRHLDENGELIFFLCKLSCVYITIYVIIYIYMICQLCFCMFMYVIKLVCLYISLHIVKFWEPFFTYDI